jgi:hypothetical protein
MFLMSGIHVTKVHLYLVYLSIITILPQISYSCMHVSLNLNHSSTHIEEIITTKSSFMVLIHIITTKFKSCIRDINFTPSLQFTLVWSATLDFAYFLFVGRIIINTKKGKTERSLLYFGEWWQLRCFNMFLCRDAHDLVYRYTLGWATLAMQIGCWKIVSTKWW